MTLRERIRSFFSRIFRRKELEVAEIPEPIIEEKVLSKIVIFYERIRGTRIKRKVQRTYPVDMSDEEIQRQLSRQYDNGGNFVLIIAAVFLHRTYQPGRF